MQKRRSNLRIYGILSLLLISAFAILFIASRIALRDPTKKLPAAAENDGKQSNPEILKIKSEKNVSSRRHDPIFKAAPDLVVVQSRESKVSEGSASSLSILFSIQLSENEKATFVVRVHPEWAPLGADRFLKLVQEVQRKLPRKYFVWVPRSYFVFALRCKQRRGRANKDAAQRDA